MMIASADVDAALAAAPNLVVDFLLALPESQWFERKSFRVSGEKLAHALIGFANAEGGTVVLGLHDGDLEDRSTVQEAHVNRLRQTGQMMCDPPVVHQFRTIPVVLDGVAGELFAIEIPPSEHLHKTTKGECYLRIGDSTVKQTPEQIQELALDKGVPRFEISRVLRATVDDLNHKLLENYADRLGSDRPLEVLNDRTESEVPRLTAAAVLLFAERPTKFFPNALVRVTRFRGRSRETGSDANVIADEMVEGPIPWLILRARDVIRRLQPTRNAFSTEESAFVDMPLVPEDAWIEGLVNAAVHRSYSLDGDHIHVDIFDDRIEITSPGRFPRRVDLTQVEKVRRFARNPRIVRVCFDMQICREMGEGIKRIFKQMRDADLREPMYTQTEVSVTLTLSAEPRHRLLDSQYVAEVATVLTALRSDERLGTGQLANLLKGRSRRWVIDLLRTMELGGLIEWHGQSETDPRAYWTIAS